MKRISSSAYMDALVLEYNQNSSAYAYYMATEDRASAYECQIALRTIRNVLNTLNLVEGKDYDMRIVSTGFSHDGKRVNAYQMYKI